MSRVKALPDDVKKICLAYVQGYERRRQEYILRRAELMTNTPDNIVTIKDHSDPDNENKRIGVMLPGVHHASRTTEDVAARLEDLEALPDVKRMRAVEYAEKRVRRDISEPLRKKLITGIILNCQSGKKYPYKVLDVEGFSERGFYRERDKFLLDIAIYMEMVQ